MTAKMTTGSHQKRKPSKYARDQANWGGHPVDVARRTINQKPSAALILAIINNKGIVDTSEIAATVQPRKRSSGVR
jgi:hypothetical protein